MSQQLREYITEYEDECDLEIKELSKGMDLTPNHLDMILYTQEEYDKLKKLFDEIFTGCQNEYHKHFYESAKYGKWTSSQLNTFYQDKLAEFRRALK